MKWKEVSAVIGGIAQVLLLVFALVALADNQYAKACFFLLLVVSGDVAALRRNAQK